MQDAVYSGIKYDGSKSDDIVLHSINKLFVNSNVLLKILAKVDPKDLKKLLEENKMNPQIVQALQEEIESSFAAGHYTLLTRYTEELTQDEVDYLVGMQMLTTEIFRSQFINPKPDPFSQSRISTAFVKAENSLIKFDDISKGQLFSGSNEKVIALHKNILKEVIAAKNYITQMFEQLGKPAVKKEKSNDGDKSVS